MLPARSTAGFFARQSCHTCSYRRPRCATPVDCSVLARLPQARKCNEYTIIYHLYIQYQMWILPAGTLNSWCLAQLALFQLQQAQQDPLPPMRRLYEPLVRLAGDLLCVPNTSLAALFPAFDLLCRTSHCCAIRFLVPRGANGAPFVVFLSPVFPSAALPLFFC